MANQVHLVSQSFQEIADTLSEIARGFYLRGWVLGTSGNFSAVLSRKPLRLAISASGVDKGQLTPDQILLLDQDLTVVGDHHGKPSDESKLHLRVVLETGAGAVLHTHSVWSTILSDIHAAESGLRIEGYEMLKGLNSVSTHEYSEWLPIIENSQDMLKLADDIGRVLREKRDVHGFLLRRHGLYAWGQNLADAKRHVEIFEFLLETLGRRRSLEGYARGV